MTALAALLADPAQEIAFVVELTYRDPDTDTTSTVRITDGLWVGAGEVGYLRGLLDDPGDQAVQVEVDELGGIGSATLEPMRFLNLPPTVGGAGPLDFLRTKSLSGRAVTVLAGSPTEAIANYEELGAGVADGEPEFDGEAGVMTLRRKTALDQLDRDIDVASYVGEPSALEILTSAGRVTCPDTSAHHLTEFVVAGRFLHPGIGAQAAVMITRFTSLTANNFRIFVIGSSGAVQATASSGGVASSIILTSSDLFDDGLPHWFGFACSAWHAYLMIDRVVVDEDLSPAIPDTPTAGVLMGTKFESGPGWVTDLRILDHYLPPDELRTWMAVRASGDESGLVGLWRGDDAVGSTLTDYSSTGADGTITGTEGVDFAWTSSDLGDAEIAGRSMPGLIA